MRERLKEKFQIFRSDEVSQSKLESQVLRLLGKLKKKTSHINKTWWDLTRMYKLASETNDTDTLKYLLEVLKEMEANKWKNTEIS